MLTFDESTHAYAINGRPIPSVTQVIEESCPFGWHGEVVDRAARFGQALHKTCELLETGKLGSYDPLLEPWLAGWNRFLADLPAMIEKASILADIKSGVFSPKWYVQMAAYENLNTVNVNRGASIPQIEARLYSEKFGYAGTLDRFYPGQGRKIRRVAIQLSARGDYKLFESKEPFQSEFNAFVSMVNVWKWKHKNGLLGKSPIAEVES